MPILVELSEDPLAEQKEASKKGRKRGHAGPRRRWAILDVSDLPLSDLIKELFANGLCIYGLAEDKSRYPAELTSTEIEEAIANGKDVHVWHGRQFGGLDLKKRTLNATLYNAANCECLEAQNAGREVKSAQTVIE